MFSNLVMLEQTFPADLRLLSRIQASLVAWRITVSLLAQVKYKASSRVSTVIFSCLQKASISFLTSTSSRTGTRLAISGNCDNISRNCSKSEVGLGADSKSESAKLVLAIYPQVMTKIRYWLAPKPTKVAKSSRRRIPLRELCEKIAQSKTGFVPITKR